MKKMKRLLRVYLVLAFLVTTFEVVAQAPFNTGNILVYRVGNNTVGLTGVAAPVFLDEFTPGGVLVQSIAMPTAVSGANQMLTADGRGKQEGLITLAINGQSIVLTGYNAPVGTGAIATTPNVPRVIGLVDYNATINTTTSLTDFSTSDAVRSAVSTNGTDLWCAGFALGSTGGIHYTTIGSTTSTQLNTTPTQLTYLNITDGQLYISCSGSAPVRIATVGTGLPTASGQTLTSIPGFPTATTTPNQFVFADLDPSVSGMDVLYVSNEAAGIQKYSLVSGNWTLNGTVGLSTDLYVGLAASISGSTVTLYATRKGINSTSVRGADLVTITDATGYNQTFSGTPTLIATACTTANFAAFRGVALVPQPSQPKVSLKVFLQGAYNSGLGRHKDVTSTWASVLNANALNQPYNTAAFGNYAGTESVSSGFFAATAGTTDILDWVLLELRDQSTPSTVIARRAAFVREDGRIVGLDGVSEANFPGVNSGSYYLVVRHRNHLGMRTSVTIALDGNVYSAPPPLYDVTTAQSQAFQDGAITTNSAMKDLGGGVFGMWGGNANGNTNVRFTGLSNDAGIILSALGGNQAAILSSAYNSADLNMDGTVRYTGLNNDAGSLLSVLGSNQAAIFTQHQ